MTCYQICKVSTTVPYADDGNVTVKEPDVNLYVELSNDTLVVISF
jgi:hypothetical protein